MTAAGWLLMICSLSLVVGLNVFCFRRVLRKPTTTEHMHSPLEAEVWAEQICPHDGCGHRNPSGARRCARCGAELLQQR
ncbi:MAG: hypothetical protein AB1716_02570 [Planctomycetota bacterium]